MYSLVCSRPVQLTYFLEVLNVVSGPGAMATGVTVTDRSHFLRWRQLQTPILSSRRM